jgi:hypothetical protein
MKQSHRNPRAHLLAHCKEHVLSLMKLTTLSEEGREEEMKAQVGYLLEHDRFLCRDENQEVWLRYVLFLTATVR